VSVDKALAAGLAVRPLRQTLRDCVAWCHARDAGIVPVPWPQYLDRERQALAAWHRRA
jgi:hypothetical protein